MTSIEDGVARFRFFRAGASSVALVGEFNGWNESDLLMKHLGEGWWGIDLELPPGEYRFRYLADQEWHTDYAANGVERKKWGWNSILMVNAPTTSDTQRIEQPDELKIAA